MKLLSFLLGSMFLASFAGAQDLPFQAQLAQPMLTNPAFAGAMKGLNILASGYLDYSGQRHDLHYHPSAVFSADYYFKKLHSGLGVDLFTDQLELGYQHTHLAKGGINYSFCIPLKKDADGNATLLLQPGVGFAWTQMEFMYYDILESIWWPGQEKASFGDLSAGTLLYSKNLTVGLSARNLNRPVIYDFGGDRTPVRATALAAYAFHFERSKHNLFIEPQIMLDYRHSYQEFSAGFVVNYGKFNAGVTCIAYDSEVFRLGFRHKWLRVDYSYELRNWVEHYLSGAHTLTLRANLFTKKRKDLVSVKDYL